MIGYEWNPAGDPADAERRILDGTVLELMAWFPEDSIEYNIIKGLVARAAEDRAKLEMEFERH